MSEARYARASSQVPVEGTAAWREVAAFVPIGSDGMVDLGLLPTAERELIQSGRGFCISAEFDAGSEPIPRPCPVSAAVAREKGL